jgi:hypothetical protein
LIYIENLQFDDGDDDDQDAAPGSPGTKPVRRMPATAAQLKGDAALVSLLRGAAEAD